MVYLRTLKRIVSKLLSKPAFISSSLRLSTDLNRFSHSEAQSNKLIRMEVTKLFEPSAHVRGMVELDKHAFSKTIDVPCLRVANKEANLIMPLIKKNLLKVEKLRPVREVQCAEGTNDVKKEILLNPLLVHNWNSLPTEDLQKIGVSDKDFYFSALEMTYDNWSINEIFKNVLPLNQDSLTSYSRIGHIVHINLRDHLLPYKNLIGQVLLEKVAGCRTVVNKAATIDNTYRNFKLELICGDADYHAEVKENGTTFEFDFSLVYWNPRLCTEHQRIVDLLKPGDVVYDVFAGVGPFSIPAAKKKCYVAANDLNPESFRWLQHNAERNKCLSQMQLYNKDGRAFITHDVKVDLLKRWSDTGKSYNTHILMNLPAMAIEFIDAFRGLLSHEAANNDIKFPTNDSLPIVHVYCFARGSFTNTEVCTLVEQHLKLPLQSLEGVAFVRNVAPNKDMYRISFRLTKIILTHNEEELCNSNRKRCASLSSLEEIEQSPSVKLRCT